jgi:four helix bundle protein
MAIGRFEQLEVWQRAHQLVLAIYRITAAFPPEERFGLTSQMRRAAVSIPANIAEGFKRRGQRDKVHFYNISQGSLEEVCYYLLLATDLSYSIHADEHTGLVEETARMLQGLINSIEQRADK